jgi:hypothetical protein
METPQDAFILVAPIGEAERAAGHCLGCANVRAARRVCIASRQAPPIKIPAHLNTANAQEGSRV